MEQFFRTLQLPAPTPAQVMPGPVDIERQHSHSRSRPLRRYLLRGQAPCNRRRIFVEQPLLGICGFRRHTT